MNLDELRDAAEAERTRQAGFAGRVRCCTASGCVASGATDTCEAFTAPAWTAFQNSWVVPFGTTAIFSFLPDLFAAALPGSFESFLVPPPQPTSAAHNRATDTKRR